MVITIDPAPVHGAKVIPSVEGFVGSERCIHVHLVGHKCIGWWPLEKQSH